MSNVRKIYNLGNKIKEITERKSFKVSLMSFLTIFLLFGVLNSYAQEEIPETIVPDWEGEKKFHNIVNGADETEDNSQTSLGQQNLTTAWTFSLYLGADYLLDEETKQKLEAANVPYDLRKGLIGMVGDASTALYANYPLVDVPGHLAQQWVPGYKDSTTALYAQDDNPWSGYDELKHAGLQSLWTNVLNLSYLFFVIVMIIAGFMIMFRHKIGGQAMVTLGNVLPNVIIALVVATFSFAIAGLIIDFGGLIIALISGIFKISEDVSISNFGSLFGNVFRGDVVIATILTGLTGSAFGVGLLALLHIPGVKVFVGLVGGVVMFIILAIIAIGAVKVLITLFKAYFQLLISVILGPLQITLGAIPGNNKAIMNWMKGVLRNVLVFPVVYFIINLPYALQGESSSIKLRLPAKLVGEEAGYTDGSDFFYIVFMVILKIFLLYFAAQAPKFIESFLPPDSNKGLAAGFDAVRGSLQKVPLIGGMFGSK